MTGAPADPPVTGALPDAPVPEAAPAPLLSPAPMLLPVVRAGYGIALLCAPGLALHLATGQAPQPRARTVARVLGARHLAQAVLTLRRPSRAAFLSGAGIDACHATSMLALAAADRGLRRAGITDALAASAFTVTGVIAGGGVRDLGAGVAKAAVASAVPPG